VFFRIRGDERFADSPTDAAVATDDTFSFSAPGYAEGDAEFEDDHVTTDGGDGAPSFGSEDPVRHDGGSSRIAGRVVDVTEPPPDRSPVDAESAQPPREPPLA
jgi:hypothetical protein